MTRRSLIVGKDRFVTGPWHDLPTVAYLAVAQPQRVLTDRAAVERAVEILLGSGYRQIVTAALNRNDTHVFRQAGFHDHERLHVLRHDLDGDLDASVHHLRRARRRDRPTVLSLDELAFEPFWHLGADGLGEALGATSSVRFRVAGATEVVGYAVSGRALDIGYLQRLAVHPAHLRQGIGAALVVDSLRWLRRRRGRMMLVNTQESNLDALSLYLRLGFRHEPEHLTVMSWGEAP